MNDANSPDLQAEKRTEHACTVSTQKHAQIAKGVQVLGFVGSSVKGEGVAQSCSLQLKVQALGCVGISVKGEGVAQSCSLQLKVQQQLQYHISQYKQFILRHAWLNL